MNQKKAAVPDLVRPVRSENALYTTCVALRLYSVVRGWGLARRLWSALTGRSNQLLDLEAVRRTCDVRGRRFDGIRAVPLREIRGSAGRCGDFDAGFRPLRGHSKGRWVSIAKARRMGRAMPPVELVQVGDVYFVRDGHHRISVARALGQKAIDAHVTVWRVSKPLPWERRCRPAVGPSCWKSYPVH